MPVHFLRSLLVVFTLATLGACASKPVSTEKPILRKIALIPATEPQTLTLKNENGVMNVLVPISSVAFMLDSKEKAKRFNDALAPRRLTLAQRLTTQVADALAARGYKVEVLTDIARPIDDPDDVDYQKLKTDAEMILQLRVDEVGVYSSKLSPDYLPRVNVQAKLYVMIVADPKYTYPSFDAVMARTDEIGAVFESGLDALAKTLTAQLLDTLATKTRSAP